MENLLKTIGNTPLIRLTAIEKLYQIYANLYAKAEYFNLTGSVKDRSAFTIIVEAEKRGDIKRGDYIVEATSGNMGISLTAIGKKLGYKPVIVIPEGFSKERSDLIIAYGGEVVYTPKTLGMDGAVVKAKEIARSLNGYFIDQFNNGDNVKAHYLTTGKEIYRDLDGKVDCFFACIGSGGTVSGVGKYLKEKTAAKIFGIEPSESPLLTKGVAGAHKIQGIGANFIPAILDKTVIDEVLTAPYEKSVEFCRILAKEEGLLCGLSSGAALYCAVEYLRNRKIYGNAVTLFPDGGVKYLSTGIYSNE